MASQSSVQAPASQGPASSIPNLKDRIPKLEPRKRRSQPANSTPVPETPALPSPPDTTTSSWTFKTPTRRILSPHDHEIFQKSKSAELIKAWVFGLADAVVDTPCSAVKDGDLSDIVKAILKILDEAETFVSRSPPDEQGGSRFGNKAFRGFLDLARDSSARWHRSLGVRDDAVNEVSTYLDDSFGNRNRIDYGSGHELNFVMWLLCLYQLRLIEPARDFRALVLRVFPRYLAIMRIVQMSYYLEPAGSHGVWGLDDYQFLPFLFGASQLLHHPYITPRSIHQDLTLEESSSEYLYLGQVAFVNSTKTVKGLRWHSPMLDDISSARSWAKIDAGMRRMFVAEVLGKLPVMQHFLFGSLIPADEGMSETST
jgi:serine/threonine-protein phosphatase 2A activator